MGAWGDSRSYRLFNGACISGILLGNLQKNSNGSLECAQFQGGRRTNKPGGCCDSHDLLSQYAPLRHYSFDIEGVYSVGLERAGK